MEMLSEGLGSKWILCFAVYRRINIPPHTESSYLTFIFSFFTAVSYGMLYDSFAFYHDHETIDTIAPHSSESAILSSFCVILMVRRKVN